MIELEDKLISQDIFSKQFVCNLSACKGACCWEGDFGAPLEDKELEKQLDAEAAAIILEDFLKLLDQTKEK